MRKWRVNTLRAVSEACQREGNNSRNNAVYKVRLNFLSKRQRRGIFIVIDLRDYADF